MSAIDSVYNYYLSTYGSNDVSRYDSHKKSELRNVWNNIVKVNKESPLYILKDDDKESVQKFVIDVKESARSLNNVISSLTPDGQNIQEAFEKKIASSSDPDVVSAKYIGDDEDTTEPFTIHVNQLAKSQINIGRFLEPDASSIPEGDYTFNLDYLSNQYEFQFHVGEDESNRSIQNRLGNLISNAKIGLSSSLVEDPDGTAALKLESAQTGLAENEETIFSVSADNAPAQNLINILGLDRISQQPQNSSFLLNGNEKSSYSNSFTINKSFEITLNGVSPDEAATDIGFKPSFDAIEENISSLIDTYNNAVHNAYEKSSSESATRKLVTDLTSSAFTVKNDLESIGLMTQSDGTIQVDKGLLYEAISKEDAQEELYDVLSKFRDNLSAKAAAVSLDPMRYVDKVVVEYKHPGHNFTTPYVASVYSGMMLDDYC